MWSALTRIGRCPHCGQTNHLALCADGRRRAFDLRVHPAGVSGVWAWHRRQGMRETDLAPGYRLHSCNEPARSLPADAMQGNGDQ